jgi:hypothetical protein
MLRITLTCGWLWHPNTTNKDRGILAKYETGNVTKEKGKMTLATSSILSLDRRVTKQRLVFCFYETLPTAWLRWGGREREAFIMRRMLVYKTEGPLVCSYLAKRGFPGPAARVALSNRAAEL